MDGIFAKSSTYCKKFKIKNVNSKLKIQELLHLLIQKARNILVIFSKDSNQVQIYFINVHDVYFETATLFGKKCFIVYIFDLILKSTLKPQKPWILSHFHFYMNLKFLDQKTTLVWKLKIRFRAAKCEKTNSSFVVMCHTWSFSQSRMMNCTFNENSAMRFRFVMPEIE